MPQNRVAKERSRCEEDVKIGVQLGEAQNELHSILYRDFQLTPVDLEENCRQTFLHPPGSRNSPQPEVGHRRSKRESEKFQALRPEFGWREFAGRRPSCAR